MPDLTGTPKKLLLPLLLRQDISVTLKGSGFVVHQEPPPGTKVSMRSVTIGPQQDDRVSVVKGLNAGETVVTDGQLRLTPDAKVNIKSALSSTNATTMGK